MEEKITIENALLAIQDFGFSPDSAEVHVFSKMGNMEGVWYDEEILSVSDIEAKFIAITVSPDKVIINAEFH